MKSALEWQAERNRLARERLAAEGFDLGGSRVKMKQGEPRVVRGAPHGTLSGYGWHKCRCDRCRAAYAKYRREGLRKRKEAGKTPAKHGRYGYTGYGCRCEVCVEANTQYSRDRRAALRSKKGTPIKSAAGPQW